jgi:hypothetical protein
MLSIGCGKRKAMDPNIPAALQEKAGSSSNSFDLSYSKSRGANDLVNDLFYELAESDPNLKSIVDRQLDMIVKMEDERRDLFSMDSKCNQFYNDANAHIGSISDSTKASRMRIFVAQSQKTWKQQMLDRDASAAELENGRQRLIDELHILKLRLTLPQIEDYQRKTMPALDQPKKFLEQQNALSAAMQNYARE